MINEEHMETLREAVQELVENDELGVAVSLITNRHPADQADLIEKLEAETRERIVPALSSDQLAEILEYLGDELRADLLAQLPDTKLAPVLDRVDEDLAADIVQDLPREQAERLVPLLEDREAVRELLTYPEESAGGRMSREAVALKRDWTVDEAIQFLRREPLDEEQPFYLYVADDDGRLTGVVNMRKLITSAPETPIAAIMSDGAISVRTDEDQEVAAERLRHYNLMALPVTDGQGRLRGVISADDVLDVQVEEATEDIYRMAGLVEEERIFRPIREALPPRLAWLLVNLCTAMLAAVAVNIFEGTIEQVAALAVFMPIVAGMAGNAGIQTITLVVRSIALGEIEARDAVRVLRHEAIIAAVKGIVIGVLVGFIAWIWKDSPWLGVIVGFALLANIANATLIAVLVPLTLRRLKADPALASGVIVTTFSDVMGFLIFLGLATIFITQLT